MTSPSSSSPQATKADARADSWCSLAGRTAGCSPLVIEQGGYEASWGGTWRFRFEPASGRLQLVALDLEARERGTGASRALSTNYLTGKRTYEVVHRGGKRTRHAEKVPAKPVFLEDATSDALDALQTPDLR